MQGYLFKQKIYISFITIAIVSILMTGMSYSKQNDKHWQLQIDEHAYFLKRDIHMSIEYYTYLYRAYMNTDKSFMETYRTRSKVTQSNTGEYAVSIPVLLYHSIVKKPDGSNVTTENFSEQIFLLHRNGWRTISLNDFYAFLRGWKKDIPKKSFLITFDDGTKDTYYPVDPILRVLGYDAVSFVITSHNGGPNYYLSEREVKNLVANPRWNIQSHSKHGHFLQKINKSGEYGHFFSNKIWLNDENRLETKDEFETRILHDFINSKEDLQKTADKYITAFSFPFGDFGIRFKNYPQAEDVVKEVSAKVYEMLFYQSWGGVLNRNYPHIDSGKDGILINRISVDSQWDAQTLVRLLDEYDDKKLPFDDAFLTDKNWIKRWGNVEHITYDDSASDTNVDTDIMKLSAATTTTGASTVLKGSYLFDDYVFEAIVNKKNGYSFAMFNRYHDDNNYILCIYTDEYIKAEEHINGQKKTIAKVPYVFPENQFITVASRVKGRDVECYVDGKPVVRGVVEDYEKLKNGSIGFTTWDKESGKSDVLIKRVSIHSD
jgi:peptidoglycan/xylan/chitin deacetylase (PgdA/CDA1 family)